MGGEERSKGRLVWKREVDVVSTLMAGRRPLLLPSSFLLRPSPPPSLSPCVRVRHKWAGGRKPELNVLMKRLAQGRIQRTQREREREKDTIGSDLDSITDTTTRFIRQRWWNGNAGLQVLSGKTGMKRSFCCVGIILKIRKLLVLKLEKLLDQLCVLCSCFEVSSYATRLRLEALITSFALCVISLFT